METILLLTGCINPNRMSFTKLTDVNERKMQYVDAIHYYLNETNNKIIFCENSNTSIHSFFNNDKDRIEILCFSGNQDNQKGKGYGEAEIIKYAFQYSNWLKGNQIVVKITGRLIISNIRQIIQSLKFKHNIITCRIHSDLRFADSRIICSTTSFYMDFLKNRNHIDDSKGVYFEQVLCDTILNSPIPFIPFAEEPIIYGISGTTGEKYQIPIQDYRHKILYKRYSFEQLLKIYKISCRRKLNIFVRFIIWIKLLKYRLLSVVTIFMNHCSQ